MATPRPARGIPARPQTPIERFSAPLLLRLHALPRWAFPIFTALLLLGGLLASNAVLASVLLSVLVLLLAWLVALSWPLLSVVARLMRLGVLGMLVFLIVSRLAS